MEKIKDPIGKKIKAVRIERNVSVPKLALILNIPKDRIYKWEQGAAPKFEDRQLIEKWISAENWNKIPQSAPEASLFPSIKTSLEPTMNKDIVVQLQDKLTKTYEERIKELKEDKAFLQRMMETSLSSTPEWAKTLLLSQTAHDEVMMNAIDRLEKKPEGMLSAEADKLESEMKDRLKNEQKSDKKPV